MRGLLTCEPAAYLDPKTTSAEPSARTESPMTSRSQAMSMGYVMAYSRRAAARPARMPAPMPGRPAPQYRICGASAAARRTSSGVESWL